MRLPAWLRVWLRTEGWAKAEAARWAERYYPHEQRETAAKVVALVVTQLNVPFAALAPASRFVEDLRVIDLDAVEVIMALEEEFGIEIAEGEAQRIRTLDEVVRFVRTKTP